MNADQFKLMAIWNSLHDKLYNRKARGLAVDDLLEQIAVVKVALDSLVNSRNQ